MSPPTRRGAPVGSASHGASRQASSTEKDSTGKQMHLHLARLAGVDIDLILGDLAAMGWALSDDDAEFLAEFPARMTGAGR